jgi:hypothetical protein
LFGSIILGLLLITKWFWPHNAPLARCDFLSLSAMAVQVLVARSSYGNRPRGQKSSSSSTSLPPSWILSKPASAPGVILKPASFAWDTCRCSLASCMPGRQLSGASAFDQAPEFQPRREVTSVIQEVARWRTQTCSPYRSDPKIVNWEICP